MISSRSKALIFFRTIFTTILLGSYFLLKIEPIPFPYPELIKYTVISIYLITVIYLITLRLIERKGKESTLKRFLYIQVILDCIITLFIISITGGVESWFTFIMLVNVVVSGIIINKKAAYIVATILSILYGVLIDLQYYKVIPISFDPSLKVNYFIYNIIIHIISLYLIAYLVGYLTTRLEKTSKGLEKATIDLKRQELLNTIIIESVPSGIFTIDESNTIITFNTPAEKITAIKKENAIGKNILEILPFLKEEIDSVIHQNIPLRLEGTIMRGGEEVIIGITLSPFKKDGAFGIIGVFQDLTEFKKREMETKRREKLAAIGELSRNIAHEIRNPLASLKGSIEMLLEERVSGEQKKRLMEIAVKEMERLDKIITDFLFYTRPKPPEKNLFDLSEIIDETILILRTSPKAEGVKIESTGKVSEPLTGVRSL